MIDVKLCQFCFLVISFFCNFQVANHIKFQISFFFWFNELPFFSNCFGKKQKKLGFIKKLIVLMTFRIGCWIQWTDYSMKIFSNFNKTIQFDRTVKIQHSKTKSHFSESDSNTDKHCLVFALCYPFSYSIEKVLLYLELLFLTPTFS